VISGGSRKGSASRRYFILAVDDRKGGDETICTTYIVLYSMYRITRACTNGTLDVYSSKGGI